MTDIKAELLALVRSRRAVMLAKLDGLSEYDRRRPLTPTGTNVLGLVKQPRVSNRAGTSRPGRVR